MTTTNLNLEGHLFPRLNQRQELLQHEISFQVEVFGLSALPWEYTSRTYMSLIVGYARQSEKISNMFS